MKSPENLPLLDEELLRSAWHALAITEPAWTEVNRGTSRKATRKPSGSGRRGRRLDHQRGQNGPAAHGHYIVAKERYTRDIGHKTTLGKALTGATGCGGALRHRCAVRHRAVAWALSQVTDASFGGHCTRPGHGCIGNRRKRHSQRKQYGKNGAAQEHLITSSASIFNSRGIGIQVNSLCCNISDSGFLPNLISKIFSKNPLCFSDQSRDAVENIGRQAEGLSIAVEVRLPLLKSVQSASVRNKPSGPPNRLRTIQKR